MPFTLAPTPEHPYPYAGPARLGEPIEQALRQVVDPEMALSIVDLGLVQAVTITPELARVTMTMTSAACPVADVIVDDVDLALDRVLPPDLKRHVEVVWEPAWTPDRMTPRAKAFMGW
ncbi:MAG: metal-sulfur cluster assembly factor [Ideonella sp.]|nr:metal-sulfur cluster assembly factor [Ideonella sp.]